MPLGAALRQSGRPPRGADETPHPAAAAPLARGRRAGRRLFRGFNPVRSFWLGLLLLLLGFLTLYPMAMLLYGSLHSTPPGMAGTFNLDGYRALLSRESLVILANTVGISFLHSVFSMVLAILFAWIIARTDTPGRQTLEVLITLPFFIPPLVTAMAWAMLGNPRAGALNQLWKALTGAKQSPIDIYSYGGVIWHMMQYATPFLFLLIVDAMRAIDPSLEEASRMSGAGQWRTFRRVTLMMLAPILTGAFLLSFIRGIESFDSAWFLGMPAGIKVITTTIYDSITQRATPDYQYATALSFTISAMMCLLLVLQWSLLRGRSFYTVTGKGYAPRLHRLGRWRWATFALCVLFFVITVVLPVGQLLLGSFFKFFGFYRLDMLTLNNYRMVLENDELGRSIVNTAIAGVVGATLTMVLGSIVAYVTIRTRWRIRVAIEALAWLPWLLPGIVMGIGFLWAFAMLPGPVQIYGTLWALIVAYVALGTPLAVRVMAGSYTQLSADIEECSRVHGATWWQTLWRILIALSWPAFAVGWTLIFFGILRELSASILLYSVGSEVMSVELLKLWSNGKAEEVSVIGLLMMVLVIVMRIAQHMWLNRRIRVA